ncbi:MAG: hypothetical protein N4A74_20590 [Carboxylicivirga sp.]|jgi:hypothetical protein|nr:hypothetical protein [Carboxylicivirga sp.]
MNTKLFNQETSEKVTILDPSHNEPIAFDIETRVTVVKGFGTVNIDHIFNAPGSEYNLGGHSISMIFTEIEGLYKMAKRCAADPDNVKNTYKLIKADFVSKSHELEGLSDEDKKAIFNYHCMSLESAEKWKVRQLLTSNTLI